MKHVARASGFFVFDHGYWFQKVAINIGFVRTGN